MILESGQYVLTIHPNGAHYRKSIEDICTDKQIINV